MSSPATSSSSLQQAAAEASTSSFKLFPVHEQLPRGYCVATVHDVGAHRQALLRTMPGWEIANLADGSVDGACYGGRASLQKRDNVANKLAIHDPTSTPRGEPRQIRSFSFQLFPVHDKLPRGYQLATVEDVRAHGQAFLKAMAGWEIANLADGSVDGACYGECEDGTMGA